MLSSNTTAQLVWLRVMLVLFFRFIIFIPLIVVTQRKERHTVDIPRGIDPFLPSLKTKRYRSNSLASHLRDLCNIAYRPLLFQCAPAPLFLRQRSRNRRNLKLSCPPASTGLMWGNGAPSSSGHSMKRIPGLPPAAVEIRAGTG